MEEQYRQYYKKDMNKSIFCDRWTFLTRCCYKYKMRCIDCPNDIVCSKYEFKTPYGIRAVKYATLLTYARLGKP